MNNTNLNDHEMSVTYNETDSYEFVQKEVEPLSDHPLDISLIHENNENQPKSSKGLLDLSNEGHGPLRFNIDDTNITLRR